MPMMSWLPRMIDRKLFIFGPRERFSESPSLVRMWNDGTSSRSTQASQNSS